MISQTSTRGFNRYTVVGVNEKGYPTWKVYDHIFHIYVGITFSTAHLAHEWVRMQNQGTGKVDGQSLVFLD